MASGESDDASNIRPLPLTEELDESTSNHKVTEHSERHFQTPHTSEDADEHTPLLLTQSRPEVHRNSKSRTSRGSLGIYNAALRPVSDSSAIEDGFGESLVRHRSRLNSYPVAGLPEDAKRRDSLFVVEVENIRERSDSNQERQAEHDRSESKYMNVGPLRFWLVFTTILLGKQNKDN